jgi:hypothetical protein
MGSMRRWLSANLRSARVLYSRLRDRGHGRFAAMLWYLPHAAVLRAYRKLATTLNDGVLQRRLTASRFRRFQAGLASPPGGRFYVIVMPSTLHFLLPCLRLVANDLRVVLLLNGARRWEADLLRTRWPNLPQLRIATLPNSSASHGAMINLLLRHSEADFGLLDHDLYLFDRSVLPQLRFGDGECLLCLLSGESADGRWTFPLTHFLYFRVEVLRGLMQRYGIGAQIYRQVPEPARSRLAAIGLHDGKALKSYHDFFDTLHVLLALAHAEGLGVVKIELADEAGVQHVGGTSVGTHHTKDLAHLYLQLRFLELAGEPLLSQRYASLAAPFTCSAALRRQIPAAMLAERDIDGIDALIERMQRAFVAT